MPWLRSRTERSSGLKTWTLEWRDGHTVRSRPLGPVSRDEAEDELADARRALRRGRAVTPALRQVAPEKALDLYCSHLKAMGRRPGTLYHTQNILGPLFRTWSAMPLANWSRTDLQAYIAEHDWAPRTVQMLITAGKRFVRWAKESGIECADWVGSMKPPRVRYKESEALSPAAVRRLLDAARDHYLEVPVALATYGGLSRADLRELTWKEVDLKAGWITRARSKTGLPIRVPIVPDLREVLERHRGPTGLVCGRLPKHDSALSKALHRLCDRAGVSHGGWHRLRHSCATILQHAGWDLATIGRLLSHKPGSVVTLRYLHTDDERLKAAAEAVAKALRTA